MMTKIVLGRLFLASRNGWAVRARGLVRGCAVACVFSMGCDDQGCASCAPLAQDDPVPVLAPVVTTPTRADAGPDVPRTVVRTPPAAKARTARVTPRRPRTDAGAPKIATVAPGPTSSAVPSSGTEASWFPVASPEGGAPEQAGTTLLTDLDAGARDALIREALALGDSGAGGVAPQPSSTDGGAGPPSLTGAQGPGALPPSTDAATAGDAGLGDDSGSDYGYFNEAPDGSFF